MYYYDDPLAAAWMLDKFGMEMQIIAGSSGDFERWDRRWFHLSEANPDKIYIHPDSLHLLAAHEGDMVNLFINMGGSHVGWWHETGKYRFTGCHPVLMSAPKNYAVHRIIERKMVDKHGVFFNIPFIWPKKDKF